MNQILASAAAVSLALILWGLGRKPSKLMQQQGNGNMVDLTQVNQISLLSDDFSYSELAEIDDQTVFSTETVQISEQTSKTQERLQIKRQLKKFIVQGPEARLKAVQLARASGSNEEALRTLRIGLKDSDSRVVLEAAAGIQQHKGKPKPNRVNGTTNQKPPRNVSLMR